MNHTQCPAILGRPAPGLPPLSSPSTARWARLLGPSEPSRTSSGGYHANLPTWPLVGTEPGAATEVRTRVRGAEGHGPPGPPISHLPGTLRHLPDTIWSKLDLASGCLSRDLGVKMISWKGNMCPSGPSPHPWAWHCRGSEQGGQLTGFRKGSRTWRRSTWK